MKAAKVAAAMAVLLLQIVSCSRKGSSCEADGVEGICMGVSSCPSAYKQILKGIKSTVCSYEDEIIVCCTVHPARQPIHWMYPTTPAVVVTNDQCEPVPAGMTVPKTGQKALDKCLEYQEKLVFPCKRSLVPTRAMARVDHCNWKPEILIIDGENVHLGEFPHMVLLGYGDGDSLEWLSAGSLISDRFILTSAHCTQSAWSGAVTKVMIGVQNKSDFSRASNRIYNVLRTHVHPEYKSPFKHHDIALLETDRRMHLDRFAVPACLPTGGHIDDSEVDVTGWGITSYGSSVMSDVLQKVTLTKFTDEECSAKLKGVRLLPKGYDPNTQVCYGDKKTYKDSCRGDSGGSATVKHPDIFCMYSLVGVISWGKKCGKANNPGVYIRVEPYVPWIVSIVWPNSAASPYEFANHMCY